MNSLICQVERLVEKENYSLALEIALSYVPQNAEEEIGLTKILCTLYNLLGRSEDSVKAGSALLTKMDIDDYELLLDLWVAYVDLEHYDVALHIAQKAYNSFKKADVDDCCKEFQLLANVVYSCFPLCYYELALKSCIELKKCVKTSNQNFTYYEALCSCLGFLQRWDEVTEAVLVFFSDMDCPLPHNNLLGILNSLGHACLSKGGVKTAMRISDILSAYDKGYSDNLKQYLPELASTYPLVEFEHTINMELDRLGLQSFPLVF